MPALKARRKTKNRVFTGCGTCRSRHLKCDEARPICASCKRLNLTCEGYTSNLLWLADDPSDNGPSTQRHRPNGTRSVRHPLFSESERRTLAAELTASFNGVSAGVLLSQIDEACDGSEESGELEVGLQRGPFHVFKALPETHSTTSLPEPGCITNGIAGEDEGNCTPTAQEPSYETAELTLPVSHAGNWTSSSMPPAVDPCQPLSENFWPQTLFDDQLWWDSLDPFATISGGFSFPWDGVVSSFSGQDLQSAQPAPPPEHVFRTSPQECPDTVGLIEQAPELLRYFQDDSYASRVPIKTFWGLSALPVAMRTFAELTVFQNSDHLSSSVFYATLASSATSRAGRSNALARCDNSLDTARKAELVAKYHLRLALETNVGTGQYKEALMSTLALALVSTYNDLGNSLDYLVDAEHLIRKHGLRNPDLSFELRVLHHVYTCVRILVESVRPPAAGLTEDLCTRVSERFNITEDRLGVGLDEQSEKSPEVGYNDIHLQSTGKWTSTLFTELYGIPETLFTLLSQTISLANGKPGLEASARRNRELSDALQRHIKRLESNIWASQPKCSGQEEADADISMRHQLASAVHHAICIYFYRRIRIVHAMVLQEPVRKVFDDTQPWLEKLGADQDLTFLIAWPIFVAACEATTAQLQGRAIECLSYVEGRTAFFGGRRLNDVARGVWEHRQSTGDYTTSWLDVPSQNQLCLP
ncbi:hypothetical protein MBLNU230_g5211t1 [Neophaeotheca triangularis]